jgi:hypothetical protein
MRRFGSFALAAAMGLAISSPSDAQLGGLVKKKVEEKAKAPEKKDAGPGAQSPFNGDVLEITPSVFEGFVHGLRTEVALTREFRAELAKHPTVEQERECTTKWALTPEAQKLMLGFQPPENTPAEQLMELQLKHSKNMEAEMRKRCPKNVNDVWPNGKRNERLEEIKVKAAASAGPVASGAENSGGHEDHGGPSDVETHATAFYAPLVAGLTVTQYGILLERIKRFCDELKANAALGRGGSGGVRFPGSGAGMFWVYSATEAQTLSQANCQRVYDLIGQLI